MKHRFTAFYKRPFLRALCIIVILLIGLNKTEAQLPDCTTGTIVYGVFSPNNPPTGGIDSTEIRPINTTTGAVGALMGNRRYYIRHQLGGTWYYGSASLGLDAITHRFFIMTQMGGNAAGSGAKDIISIDPTAPTATGTVIATTPSAYDNYHFVKLAIAPNGFGYAIGVHRDTTTAAATYSPLVRFSTCGLTPATNCANGTVITLGYLPSTGMMYKQRIYNGDIVFDWGGNLYFLSAAFEKVGAVMKYTDARLFKIKSTDIPSAAGAGTIPMTYIADYNIIDSTGVSGLAVDNVGNMNLSVKRFTNNDPTAAYVSEFYRSTTLGSATLLALAPIPGNTSLSDLGSCLFPTGVLAARQLDLASQYTSGYVDLRWSVDNDAAVAFYELQRGDDDMDMETVSKVYSRNSGNDQTYTYRDAQSGSGSKFYRVRETMKDGNIRYYSNVTKVSFNSKIDLISAPRPNPISTSFDVDVQLSASSTIQLRLMDQSGRITYTKIIHGQYGANKIHVDGLAQYARGVYVMEISVDEQTVRQKLVKQ